MNLSAATAPVAAVHLDDTTMNARPRTTASKKRIMRRTAERRAGNKPQLGIPPKGKGWLGKRPVEKK
jgi:hypothetical protein